MLEHVLDAEAPYQGDNQGDDKILPAKNKEEKYQKPEHGEGETQGA